MISFDFNYLVSIRFRISWLSMFYHFLRHWNVEIHNYMLLFRKGAKSCPLTSFSKHLSTTKLTFLFVSLLLCLPPLCPLSLPRRVPFCGPGGFGTPGGRRPRARPPQKILYKVAWPGKSPEKSQSMLVRPLYRGTPSHSPRPLRTANASIKWPDRVKPPKNHNRCWTGHFIEAFHPIPPDPFEQRMPL